MRRTRSVIQLMIAARPGFDLTSSRGGGGMVMQSQPARALTLLGLVCGLGLLSPATGLAAPQVDYSPSSSWLCRPGRADACSGPITSTVVSASDGTLSRKAYTPDPHAVDVNIALGDLVAVVGRQAKAWTAERR